MLSLSTTIVVGKPKRRQMRIRAATKNSWILFCCVLCNGEWCYDTCCNQIMLSPYKIELSTCYIYINKKDSHRCFNWEAIGKVSRSILRGIGQAAPWAGTSHLLYCKRSITESTSVSTDNWILLPAVEKATLMLLPVCMGWVYITQDVTIKVLAEQCDCLWTVTSTRHQVIYLMCRHHIWFCLADCLPVPTGRLARRISYTSVPFPYPQLFYWAYALVGTEVSSTFNWWVPHVIKKRRLIIAT